MTKINLDINKIVQVTENHGGYLAGNCLACDASGWMDTKFGYPFRVRSLVMSNRLTHKLECPMNKYLKIDGTLNTKGR